MDNDLKKKFLSESEQKQNPKYLIVAVKLPNGAVEIITNTEQIQKKIEYYKTAYDDDFVLKSTTMIQIVNFMLV